MSNSAKVFRIYVEKKPAYAVEANQILADILTNLQLTGLTGLRLFHRYDVQNITEKAFQKATITIFAEPPVDTIYDEFPPHSGTIFAVQYLPGQFDQRADSCSQSIQLLTQEQRPLVRSAKVYALEGVLTPAEVQIIKEYLINPVEAEEAGLEPVQTLAKDYPLPEPIPSVAGFTTMSQEALMALIEELGLAMDLQDILFCQQYFLQEGKDPSLTEIKLIDTYWSDHCRHTTFLTNINQVTIETDYIQKAYDSYLKIKGDLGRGDKPTCLMDIATIATRHLKAQGKLKDLDESEEINACSIRVKVEIDGAPEDWLLMFKNETHNHPTEIEPFGGAATCLGGAIRDPLSGRVYVYQAMRVTGAGNPLAPVSATIKGKLPQKKLVTTAAAGYSSYGNQIGLATGLVQEIYHPNYVAKRMEIGAVVGAAPLKNVVRTRPQPGDLVLLLGGATGRDGCGGATGSSKSHTAQSLATCGAEVQKGNPPEERKIQRLFRNPKVTQMIKRCNDFGAGGVSVAIGELADGLIIDLDAIPKKYEGLNGTELAISESQERMAVVIDPSHKADFLAEVAKENLLGVEVAVVTEEPRLKMQWQSCTIVDISRAFLDSNGAPKDTNVLVTAVDTAALPFSLPITGDTYEEKLISCLTNLNTCSQKGLAERFDSTIGAGTITMPFGGKYQKTPTPFMAAKLPVLQGQTNTASVMSFGFNPYISEKSPYHGGVLAVVDSVTKLVAAGLDYQNLWLTLQEYFERTNNQPARWGKPFAALLGALQAQIELGIAAIGGKDSMSGSFEDIDVPPTLVSFAIGTASAPQIITPEFKTPGNLVYLFKPTYEANRLPSFNSLKQVYNKIHQLAQEGTILSAYAVGMGGISEAVAKMAFGNNIGFQFSPDFFAENRYENNLFKEYYGSIIIESSLALQDGIFMGSTLSQPHLIGDRELIPLGDLVEAWQQVLEPVYPTKTKEAFPKAEAYSYELRSPAKPATGIAQPKILLPVFPGTNCEYDTARQFEQYGGKTQTYVIGNLTPQMVEDSVKDLVKAIQKSQIIMLPGGFSGGDEPDGSGKFIATFFRNPAIQEAIMDLLQNRDGLMLGICNGFQALVKLGLLPFGEIRDMDENSPTLTFNSIGRHQSMIVSTKIVSIKSPWLAYNPLNAIHSIAISHGEGKFVAPQKTLAALGANGQICTQYVDLSGHPTMQLPFNPNGSYDAIEGICSPDGRIFGKMGHSERVGKDIIKNIPGNKDQLLFKAGIDYFKL